MTPDVVVDVGNTRIKYALVRDGKLGIDGSTPEIEKNALLFDKLYGVDRRLHWLVAGVDPERQAGTVAWARSRGDTVTEITSYRQLPIKVEVNCPEKVGIDRLLGVVAANRFRAPGHAAVTVDVGTAMTVNVIDATGVFVGGVIVPGPRLMAGALHDGTAKLPRVETRFAESAFPAKSTEAAIITGIKFALAGAVRTAAHHVKAGGYDFELIVTGGDSELILAELLGFEESSESMRSFNLGHTKPRLPGLDVVVRCESRLNLHGLLITAETLQ